MKITFNERFKLPYMGKDVFRTLMASGLLYDRKKYMFYINSNTDVDSVNNILQRNNLKIKIDPLKTCYICNSQIDCETCTFVNECHKKVVTCICENCIQKEETLGRYILKQYDMKI